MPLSPRLPSRLITSIAAVAAVIVLSLAGAASRADAALISGNSKTPCAYSAHSISTLNAFSQMVGRQINCAMVYNNASVTWQQWESPWFINYYNPDNDWSQWATAPGTNRQLIITQNLIPSSLEGTDWLDAGAAGAYAVYARTLAQNLVNAGLGNSIIRLSPEANGTWYSDSLGSTPAQWALWDQFWRVTALAMKSVPGANFQFDWCIAALYRALPLSQIYPGSDVVNIIGVDAYDTGNIGNTAAARWNDALNGSDGIQAVANFAASQGKPLSIPEWGVSPVDQSSGFGDDPTFVNGIASVVRNDDTAYQSYFYKYGYATQLAPGTLSLAAYQQRFGANGDSLGLTTPLGASASPTSSADAAAPSQVPTTGGATGSGGSTGSAGSAAGQAKSSAPKATANGNAAKTTAKTGKSKSDPVAVMAKAKPGAKATKKSRTKAKSERRRRHAKPRRAKRARNRKA